MSYTVFTDACSNLPGRLLTGLNIRVLPCSYVLDGVPGTYSVPDCLPAGHLISEVRVKPPQKLPTFWIRK